MLVAGQRLIEVDQAEPDKEHPDRRSIAPHHEDQAENAEGQVEDVVGRALLVVPPRSSGDRKPRMPTRTRSGAKTPSTQRPIIGRPLTAPPLPVAG